MYVIHVETRYRGVGEGVERVLDGREAVVLHGQSQQVRRQ